MNKKYEHISGGESGHVDLLVRKSVIATHGEPLVDFDNLSELVEKVGLPPEETQLKLYRGWLLGNAKEFNRRLSLGAKVPLTDTIYSAVGANGPHYDLPDSRLLPKDARAWDGTFTMEKLIRNLVRISDTDKKDRADRERELYQEHYADIQFPDGKKYPR